jgi:UDP-glucuronate decarboxylase
VASSFIYPSIVREDLQNIISAALPWERLSGKTVIISGANGLLPSYMVETLLFLNSQVSQRERSRVIALVRNYERTVERFAHHKGRDDLRIVVANLANPLLLDERVNFVIHGASPASPKKYTDNPNDLFVANVLGTYNLLTVAQEHQAEEFLYISSGEVYGKLEPSQIPVKESSFGGIDPTRVRSCYAESKRIAENMCVCWHKQYGLSTKIVRPCHTFGPWLNLDDGRVFADFVRDILNEHPITLKSDGKPLRTFCYLADATEAFFTVMFKGSAGQAYNVASDQCTTTIGHLAQMLSTSFGNGQIIGPQEAQLKQTAPASEIWPDSTPDTAKIQALGWQPRTSLKEAFERTLRSYGFKIPRQSAKVVTSFGNPRQ